MCLDARLNEVYDGLFADGAAVG
ncbi:MAG: hypothetical protein QG672_453, partial [Pseudomonadota bacterium]|nr:hypothetical protein [Pseudomonadota bacterium]